MSNRSDPASNFAAVTKSDSTVLTNVRAYYIGGAGDVAFQAASGATVTFKGVAAGTILPVNAIKVMSTNTTATDIVALY